MSKPRALSTFHSLGTKQSRYLVFASPVARVQLASVMKLKEVWPKLSVAQLIQTDS